MFFLFREYCVSREREIESFSTVDTAKSYITWPFLQGGLLRRCSRQQDHTPVKLKGFH
jgi:hypothetical protein